MFGHVVWCDCTINLVPVNITPEQFHGILDTMVMDGLMADGGTCPQCGTPLKTAVVVGTMNTASATFVIRMTETRSVL